ncbi:homing endonuclease associated repeat-containing protein [Haloprofundus halobius]|uniref:homing endonuclease associated repeat-containing protein n=1 Tax=Haloprofundus halobius TaxID=2876194 RepID=UPI001CC92E2B|nr:helix-hairpin-helix domain-containing protein [Haloprofundus halobius]
MVIVAIVGALLWDFEQATALALTSFISYILLGLLISFGWVTYRRKQAVASVETAAKEHLAQERERIDDDLNKGAVESATVRVESLEQTYQFLVDDVESERLRTEVESYLTAIDELRTRVEKGTAEWETLSSSIELVKEKLDAAENEYEAENFDSALEIYRTLEPAIEDLSSATLTVTSSSGDALPPVETVSSKYWRGYFQTTLTVGYIQMQEGDELLSQSAQNACKTYQEATKNVEQAVDLAESEDITYNDIDFLGSPIPQPTLTDIDGIGEQRADSLRDHGIESPVDIVEANSLSHIPRIGEKTERRLRRSAESLVENFLEVQHGKAHTKYSKLNDWVCLHDESVGLLEKAEDAVVKARTNLLDGKDEETGSELQKADQITDEVESKLRSLVENEFQVELSTQVDELHNQLTRVNQSIRLLSSITACNEQIGISESAIQDGNFTSALDHVNRGKKHLDAANQITTQLSEHEWTQPVERRREKLDRLDNQIHAELETQKIEKRLDEAERDIEHAINGLGEDTTAVDIEASVDHLESAVSTIKTVQPIVESVGGAAQERLECLANQAEETEELVERYRNSLEFDSLIESVEEQIKAGVEASKEGSYQSSSGHFGHAKQELNAATELVGKVDRSDAGKQVRQLSRRLESERSDALRRKHFSICWSLMERAEKAVARAIDHLETNAYDDAAKGFTEAIEHLSDAEQWAQRSDLAEQWEIKQRLDTLCEYRSNAESSLETYLKRRSSEAAQHLDRANQLISKSHQQLDIEDASAANESWMTARDSLDTAKEIIGNSQLQNAANLEERHRETERRLTELRNAIERSGYDISGASRTRLVDELQELAVTIGESPREEFVDACGRYPSDEYVEMFGSWEDALRAANLEPVDWASRNRRKYTRVDILESVAELTRTFGRYPTKAEMNDQGSMSVSTVETRFGTWESALDLAERIELSSELSRDDAVAELTGISGVTATEASILYDAGLTSVIDVQKATMENLLAIDGISKQIALRMKADVGELTTESQVR